MEIDKFIVKMESPSVEEFLSLRNKIGWEKLDHSLACESLSNSLFHVTIYDNTKLIGMGRVVGDGAMYFYIQDVIVDPCYQNQGIGALIMTNIERYLSKNAITGATIGLLAATGKEGFYSRYGYVERPNNILGHGMCKFV